MDEVATQVHKARDIALDSTRNSFPEPTLLPHLAQSVTPEKFLQVLRAVELTHGAHGDLLKWPRIVEATANGLGARLERNINIKQLEQLLNSCEALWSYLPEHLLEKITASSLQANVQIPSSSRTIGLCRLAVRYPNYRDGVFPDLALASMCSVDEHDLHRVFAWYLPLADDGERQAIIDGWQSDERFELDALSAFFENLRDNERDAASAWVISRLKQLNQPERVASALVCVYPYLPAANKEQAVAILNETVTQIDSRVPPWWFAMMWSRLHALSIELDPLISLAVLTGFEQALPAWHKVLVNCQSVTDANSFIDVLRAHPGARRWMTETTYPAIDEQLRDQLVNSIANMSAPWMAVGGGEPSYEPPTESEPEVSVTTLSVGKTDSVDKTDVVDDTQSGYDQEEGVDHGDFYPEKTGFPGSLPSSGSGDDGVQGSSGGWFGRLLGGLFGGSRARRLPSPEITRGPPPKSKPVQVGPRKLQLDVQTGTKEDVIKFHSDVFTAGLEHTLHISIGRGATLSLVDAFIEPAVTNTKLSHELLEIRLLYNQTVTGATIELPHNQAKNSEIWLAKINVPQDAKAVEATIVVLHRNRVLQVARLTGPVVAASVRGTIVTTKPHIKLEVVADLHAIEELQQRGAFDLSIVTDGTLSSSFTSSTYAVHAMTGVEKRLAVMMKRLFKTTKELAVDGSLVDGPFSEENKFQQLIVF